MEESGANDTPMPLTRKQTPGSLRCLSHRSFVCPPPTTPAGLLSIQSRIFH